MNDDVVLQSPPSRRTKLAVFDFDWTIVKPLNGRKFPKDVNDWQYIRESVPAIIRKFAKDHRIVILTDQSQAWKIDMIKNVIADLAVDVTAVIGVKTKKPSTELFLKVFPKLHPERSFYVGDAAGDKGDWSDKDRVFAESLGMKFVRPEELFPLDPVKAPPAAAKAKKTQEVVIMVGYPASGKSTISKNLESEGYYRVEGDLHKSVPAMIKDAEKHIDKSIVFDSTAGSKVKRAEFVKFAQKHDLPVRVFWMQTSIDVSIERNKQRALAGGPKIPIIGFYLYRKHFEEPTEDEGFKVVKI
jgi:bifunctional polynucleotide phosphatase/kinase